MKKIILVNILLFITSCFFAQAPANDNCAGALSLDTLPAPANCGGGIQSGASTVIASTNVNATAENPYLTLAGCGMASPANSVWYTFIAPVNGYGVKIAISDGGLALANPNIALWGGSCSALVGQGCIVGSSGGATLSIPAGIIPGNAYFIQVSGNSGQSGTFNLSINAFHDCTDCNKASELTVSPLPVNGYYNPGQVVTFCYKITSWAQVNNNWLHGVQISPGSGWDLNTITTSPPASQYYTGTWAYFPSGITASNNGSSWPSGFYFDTDDTGTDPGNNFGDGGGTSGSIKGPWTFCVNLTIAADYLPGSDISVTFNTSGDGESGNWLNAGCYGDNAIVFNGSESVSVGIKKVFENDNMSISPNPTNGVLNIDFATMPQHMKVEIYNSIGALVLTEILSNKNNTINSSQLSNGMYLIKIIENNQVVTVKKLVKQ